MITGKNKLILPFRLVSISMLAKQIGCPKEALTYYSSQLRDSKKASKWVKPFVMQIRNKKRKLYNTEIPLKKLIKKINRMLSRIQLPTEFNGSVKNKSIKENASPHVGNTHMVQIDIKNFFPSIQKKLIKKIFIEIGCSPGVANLLMRLVSFDKHTPQGYPTSSAIANLFLAKYCYDGIKEICNKNNYVFSIWVDDLTLSSKNPIKEAHTQEIIRKIESNGLKVHRRKKLKRIGPNKRKMVTGIVVNEKLNLARKWVRELELKLNLAKNFGLANLAKNRCKEQYRKSVRKAKTKKKVPRKPEQWSKDHIAGLLYFARYINKEKYDKILSKHEATIQRLEIIKLNK